MLLGRFGEALAPGREAVDVARHVDAPVELCRALNSVGTSLAMLDEGDEGLALLREAIEVGLAAAAAPEVVRCYINLTSILTTPMDRLDEAEETARTGLAYAADVRAVAAPVDWLRLELAAVLHRLGRWRESEDNIAQLPFAPGGGALAQYLHTSLAVRRVLEGRYDDAIEHLREAERVTPDIKDPQAVTPMLEVRLRLQLAGRGDDARDLPPAFTPTSLDPTMMSVFPLLASVEAESPDHEKPDATRRVESLLEEMAEASRRAPAGRHLAACLEYWTRLIEAELSRLRGPSDPGRWERALVGMRRRRDAEMEIYAEFRLAEAFVESGEHDRAASELAQALRPCPGTRCGAADRADRNPGTACPAANRRHGRDPVGRRADPTATRSPGPRGGGTNQPPDRRGPVHLREDRQRAHVQHPRQARRRQPHRSRSRRSRPPRAMMSIAFAATGLRNDLAQVTA
jgi:tetratricopeptide (TPR) repeat protein